MFLQSTKATRCLKCRKSLLNLKVTGVARPSTIIPPRQHHDRFSPEDIKGESHTLGVFESETDKGRLHTYDKFITQGAKKYAVQIEDKIKITVAGVPKKAGKTLKRLEDFKDNYVFEFKDTNKLLIVYIDDMDKQKITDYLGIEYEATDKTGCCLLPTTYVLGKAIEYANLISDDSSPRARFKE